MFIRELGYGLLTIFLALILTTQQAFAYVVTSELLFDNNNTYGVYSSPTSDTVFSVDDYYEITYVKTYHWNSASGTASPGQISLQHSDGTIYGPYQAFGEAGYMGVSNAYWYIQPDVVIKPGTYTVIDSDTATWSYNSQSNYQGMTSVYGIASQSPDNTLTESITVQIPVNSENIDEVYPVPDFPVRPGEIRRSSDPFGGDSDWLESSIITTHSGGVRVNGLIMNNQPHWLDFQVDMNDPAIPLNLINMQVGSPTINYPSWSVGSDVVDFRLSQSEIYGSPAYFRLFNIGLGGIAHNIDFSYLNGRFQLSGLVQSGYQHYLPSSSAPVIGFVTNSWEAPIVGDPTKVCLANIPFGTPMSLFNVAMQDGEDYLNVNYCSETVMQKFSIHDGIATGIYASTTLPMSSAYSSPAVRALGWPFSSATPEEKMAKCIEDLSHLHIGLERDNQLSAKLVDLATAFTNELKFGNTALEATKTALVDSKNLWFDALNGKAMRGEELALFMAKTVMKNLPVEDRSAYFQKIINNANQDNIPDHIVNLAKNSGTAVGQQYTAALETLTKDTVKLFFPVSSALAETIQEGQKWYVETMADSDLQLMYGVYKKNRGNWADTYTDVMSNQANLSMKVRKILFKKQKNDKQVECLLASGSAKTVCQAQLASMREEQISGSQVDAFVKNLFADWYSQEPLLAAKKADLNQLKSEYNDVNATFERLYPDATDCERFKHFYDYVNKAKMDLAQSMGDCSSKPTEAEIESTAINMTKALFNERQSMSWRRSEYQRLKLNQLERLGCNQYTYENKVSGVWVKVEEIPVDTITQSTCWPREYSFSAGSWNYTYHYDTVCGNVDWNDLGPWPGQGSYTVPPGVLVPGQTLEITANAQDQTGKAGYATVVTGCLFDEYPDEWEFNGLGGVNNPSLQCSTLASDWDPSIDTEQPEGGFVVPGAPSDGDGALYIRGGGTPGAGGMYYYFMYRWQGSN